jgi:electron transport complex protein RnfG
LLIYLLRTWGSVPDGTAFAILLMNSAPRRWTAGPSVAKRCPHEQTSAQHPAAVIGDGTDAGSLPGLATRTAGPIHEAQRLLQEREWLAVLPEGSYDNQPLQQPLALTDNRLQHSRLLAGYRASLANKPVAVMLHSEVPDMADRSNWSLPSTFGRLIGLRVLRQQESPGLGDQLVNPARHWLDQFIGKAHDAPPEQAWALKRDRGAFDQLAGATVTSRAVIDAVQDALRYFDQHRTSLLGENHMNRHWLLSVCLAPLIGTTGTVVQALTMLACMSVLILAHQLLMVTLRDHLEPAMQAWMSMVLAAALTTCLQLGLQAWALPMALVLGHYPALLALQCLATNACYRNRPLARSAHWPCRPGGGWPGLAICRQALAGSPGLHITHLAPGALILLGLLLGLYNQLRPEPTTAHRQGTR